MTPRNTLRAHAEMISAVWHNAAEAVRLDAFEKANYGDGAPGAPRLWLAIGQTFCRDLALALVCWWRGHVLECEASIGPDGGSEYLHCSRCGWSHSITYY